MYRSSFIVVLFSLFGSLAYLVDADDTPGASIGGVRRRGRADSSQLDGLRQSVASNEALNPSEVQNEDSIKLALDELYKDLEWNRALGGYYNKKPYMSMDHGKYEVLVAQISIVSYDSSLQSIFGFANIQR
jgi:hypothetical protein